jgi:hypothetical protein
MLKDGVVADVMGFAGSVDREALIKFVAVVRRCWLSRWGLFCRRCGRRVDRLIDRYLSWPRFLVVGIAHSLWSGWYCKQKGKGQLSVNRMDKQINHGTLSPLWCAITWRWERICPRPSIDPSRWKDHTENHMQSTSRPDADNDPLTPQSRIRTLCC